VPSFQATFYVSNWCWQLLRLPGPSHLQLALLRQSSAHRKNFSRSGLDVLQGLGLGLGQVRVDGVKKASSERLGAGRNLLLARLMSQILSFQADSHPTHIIYGFTQVRRQWTLDQDSGRTKTIEKKLCMTILFSVTRGVSWRREKKCRLFTPQNYHSQHFSLVKVRPRRRIFSLPPQKVVCGFRLGLNS
jgi:hypothetical protein